MEHREGVDEETGENCLLRSFVFCILHQILWGWQNR